MERGRTRIASAFMTPRASGEALWLGDALVIIRLASERTAGAVCVLEYLSSPGSGSPLHRHTREDEWFFVLAGGLRIWVDGRLLELGSGDCAWCPRGIAHTYVVAAGEPARFLVVCEPGGFDGFVRSVARPAPERVLPAEPPAPDRQRTASAAQALGLEILGPPGIPGGGRH